jgi:hypothetical protein
MQQREDHAADSRRTIERPQSKRNYTGDYCKHKTKRYRKQGICPALMNSAARDFATIKRLSMREKNLRNRSSSRSRLKDAS